MKPTFYHFRRLRPDWYGGNCEYVLFGGKLGREKYQSGFEGDDLGARGGVTIAVTKNDEGGFVFGVSVCSDTDVFNKNLGRTYAEKRLTEVLETDERVGWPEIDSRTKRAVLKCFAQMSTEMLLGA